MVTRRRSLVVPLRLEVVALSSLGCASNLAPDVSADAGDARVEVTPSDVTDATDAALVFDGYTETAPRVFCSRTPVTWSLCRECPTLDARLTGCGRCFTLTGNPQCVLCFEAGDGGAAPLTHCA